LPNVREERVSTYWPEFAQQGKEEITVRQLLSHQAGLFALDEPIDRSLLEDFDRLAVVLARQKPTWTPGNRIYSVSNALGVPRGRAPSQGSVAECGRNGR
jgi:CubicO group peptidase (beta-lactamase class C family)